MGQGVIIKNKYYNGKIDITFPVLLSHLLIVLFTYFNFVFIYIYIYICIYIYMYIYFSFFFFLTSHKISSLNGRTLFCVFMLFHV